MTAPPPAELEALTRVLRAKEAEHAEAAEERMRKRDEVRSLDRLVQKLEAHIAALREILNDADGHADRGAISVIRPGEDRSARASEASLHGLPRVQAIEIILAEAGSNELHRQEIFEQLRTRGFPAEQLGDTSAALAYLKRTGRVVNPARGYWRAA
jgi:hypothetical protein